MSHPPPLRAWASALLALSLAACANDPGSSFDRSCRGERVLECDPNEYTVAHTATLTPAGIRPTDPAAMATVRLELDRCPMHPGTAEVALFALIPRFTTGVDAGEAGVRVVDLGITLRDDGTNGDTAADDGVIEGRLTNPFGREIPGETTIVVRFAPVLAGCAGDAVEIEYETGPAFVAP